MSANQSSKQKVGLMFCIIVLPFCCTLFFTFNVTSQRLSSDLVTLAVAAHEQVLSHVFVTTTEQLLCYFLPFDRNKNSLALQAVESQPRQLLLLLS